MNKRIRKKKTKQLMVKLADVMMSQLRPGQHVAVVHTNDRNIIKIFVVNGSAEVTANTFEEDFNTYYSMPQFKMSGAIITEGTLTIKRGYFNS